MTTKQTIAEEHILSVGYHKSEMDFGVNCSIVDLSYEQMNELRIMTMVMIGQAESMWRRARQDSPVESLETKQFLADTKK